MTNEQYKQFEQELISNGFRKYQGKLMNEDWYFAKGYGYVEGDPSYQVVYSIWDWEKYPRQGHMPDYSSQITVLLHGNNRTDLSLSGHELNIKEVETIAQSFYEWAQQSIKL